MDALCPHLKIPSDLMWRIKRAPAIPTLEDLGHILKGCFGLTGHFTFPKELEFEKAHDHQQTSGIGEEIRLKLGVGPRQSHCNSLQDCHDSLRELGARVHKYSYKPWAIKWSTHDRYLLRYHDDDEGPLPVDIGIDCLRVLRGELQRKGVVVDALLPLVRDALMLYCGGKACPSLPQYGLWFLFLARCWNRNSLLPDSHANRKQACRALLTSHIHPQAWNRHLSVQLPIECLHSHLSVLVTVCPGTLIEEIDNFFDDVGARDTGEKWDSPAAHEQSEQLNVKLQEAMPDLKQFLPRMLLEAFGSMGREAIRYVQLRTFMDFEEVCSLSRIGRELGRAAISVFPAEKYTHLGRALDEIAEVRREYLSEENRSDGWTGTEDVAGTDISVRTALDKVEDIVKLARAALPLSPLAMDLANRRESFYFAFLIDHENFFAALYDYIIHKVPHLGAHRDRSLEMKMFDYKISEQSKPVGSKRERKTPTYIVYRGAYGEEHRILMSYVLQQLQRGWEKHVGVQDLDYYRAYAYWGRHFPHAHDEVYGEFRIKPDRPRGAPHPGSQAVDQEIFAEIAQIAASQKRTPFFAVVSGDAGYLPVLDRLREVRGFQYQYWFFEHQPTKPQLAHLRGTWVRLEDILELDKLDVSKLEAAMNERRENERRGRWRVDR